MSGKFIFGPSEGRNKAGILYQAAPSEARESMVWNWRPNEGRMKARKQNLQALKNLINSEQKGEEWRYNFVNHLCTLSRAPKAFKTAFLTFKGHSALKMQRW